MLLCAMGLGLGACDDGPSAPPPVPGVVTVRLVSPNGADGAAVLEVDGDVVNSATAAGAEVYTVDLGERKRIVVVRPDAGEIRADLAVRDTAADIDAHVVEVADSTNALRASLAGYEVEVSS